MKNKRAAELREQHEAKVREAANEKNRRISQAKSDFATKIKAIRREIWGAIVSSHPSKGRG